MDWPFGDMRQFGYKFIMADNPWTFQLYSDKGDAKSAQAQYDCMTLDDIKNLPVGLLADKDCILFLWTTWPLLLGNVKYPVDGISRENKNLGAAYSPAGDVVRAWGFNYVTGGVWHKQTINEKDRVGTGYRIRSVCEPFLIATNGNPENSKSSRNLIRGLAREHSRKPESAYKWAEDYMPDVPRADLFSREKRPGWDNWGREANLFNDGGSPEVREIKIPPAPIPLFEGIDNV